MTVCLGLDYGLRRIGVAAGDTERRLAFAVTTHVEGRDGSVLDLLRKQVAERGVGRIVLGLPLTADGREAGMAERVRRFATVLERELGLDVVLWDERYSSAEADRWLPTGRRTGKRRRRPGRRDHPAILPGQHAAADGGAGRNREAPADPGRRAGGRGPGPCRLGLAGLDPGHRPGRRSRGVGADPAGHDPQGGRRHSGRPGPAGFAAALPAGGAPVRAGAGPAGGACTSCRRRSRPGRCWRT